LELLFQNPGKAKSIWQVYDRIRKASQPVNLPENVGLCEMFADDHTIFFTSQNLDNGQDESAFLNLSTGKVSSVQTGKANIIYAGSSPYANCLFALVNQDSLVAFLPDGNSKSVVVDPKIRLYWVVGGDANNVYFLGKPKDKSRREIKATLNKANFSITYNDFAEGELDQFKSVDKDRDLTHNASGDMNFVEVFSEQSVPSVEIQPQVSGAFKSPKKPSSMSLIPKQTRLGPAGGQVVFSAKQDFVVYQDAGALLVRDINPIDLALAEKLALDDIKSKLLSRAKMIGTGFAIYAADNDDIFPGAEGWENKLYPYMKDRDTMNNFSYSFRGGDVTKVQDPANTELGFFVGPGGRAVVYIDGHAKWITNP
jgi:hypothetical protein